MSPHSIRTAAYQIGEGGNVSSPFSMGPIVAISTFTEIRVQLVSSWAIYTLAGVWESVATTVVSLSSTGKSLAASVACWTCGTQWISAFGW